MAGCPQSTELTAHPQLTLPELCRGVSFVTADASGSGHLSNTQALAFSTSGTCLIAWNLDYAVLYRAVTNAELILGGVPEVDDPILQTRKSQGKVGQCIMGHQEPQPDSNTPTCGKPDQKSL